MLTVQEALDRLREGNRRFAEHALGIADAVNHTELSEMVRGQKPFAVILGCADSRVPAEVVFDQGLGALFVVRVAGNVAAESQIGSIEYAVTHFATPLVVVMGHSHCGAVTAALDALMEGQEGESAHLGAIMALIRPSIESLVRSGLAVRDGLEDSPEDAPEDSLENGRCPAGGSATDRSELVERGVRANVRHTVSELTRRSEILAERVRAGELLIVGAEYELETGWVEFFNRE